MNSRKSVPKQKDFKLVPPLTPGLLRGAPLCPVPSSAAPQGAGTPRSRHPEEQAAFALCSLTGRGRHALLVKISI